MMRRLRPALLAGVAVIVCAASRPAQAKLFDIYASARAGGAIGWGHNALNPQASDFFEKVRGPGVGAEIGVELLLVSGMINFTQLFDSEGPAGTFTQFLLGFDGDLALEGGGKPRTFLRLGVAAGVALGTHRPVDPPLDNRQVSDKGFVAQATVAIDRRLNDVFSIGIEVIPGTHYFFAGGDAPANERTNQSQGTHIMGFAILRAHFGTAQ